MKFTRYFANASFQGFSFRSLEWLARGVMANTMHPLQHPPVVSKEDSEISLSRYTEIHLSYINIEPNRSKLPSRPAIASC